MTSTTEIVTLEAALGLQRKESVALYREHVNPDLCAQFSLVGLDRRFVRASGMTVFDEAGNEYLDFLGGYGALSFGHNHPEIVEAVRRVEDLPNILQASVGALVGPLAASLAAIAPGDLSKSFFCNSGAEAVEGSLKLARISTKRTHIVYADNSFHGKSMGALSVTGRSKYQKPFEPLVPHCHAVPFGDIDALESTLRSHECAAFIVEPVQGEAGVMTPPDGYLKAVEEVCHANGALFIADEIQSGLGRTGTVFAVDYDGAKPDIMATAKALGGGVMPIGAYTASDRVWEAGYGTAEKCVLHTSTFGGNTRAMAAGLKAIEILVRDDLSEAARVRGEKLKSGLERIAATTGLVKEVRGRGLMIGVEFYEPKVAKKLSGEYLASAFAGLLLNDHGIITAFTLNNPNVIRFEPPLIVTDEQIDYALGAFEKVCAHYHGAASVFAGLGRTMLTRKGR